MKNNPLRVPLINSAIILSVLALLVYFTVTSAEGSVWSSIGAIFLLVFRIAQLAVGLGLALLVCLGVLIGIFLGAVAIFDGSAASRMYEGLRSMILTWSAPLAGLFKSDRDERLAAALAGQEERITRELADKLSGIRGNLSSLESELTGRIQALAARIGQLEENAASREALDEQAEAIGGMNENLAGLDERVKAVQGKVDELARECGKVDAAQVLGDLPARVEALEQADPVELPEIPEPVDLTPLQEEIAALKAELAELRQAAAGSATGDARKEAQEQETGADQDEEEHRLFTYFDDPDDRKKLAELVAQTLKKDMTYAQVTEFLIKEMGKEAGQIISEHPSLAKDYIRQCRRKM